MYDTVLEPAQLESLLEQPDLSTAVGVRNMAMILLFLDAGAKVGELVGKEGSNQELRGGLRLDDLDLEQSPATITLRRPRDGSARVVELPLPTVRYLTAWLSLRPKTEADLVFVTSRGTRILNRYVRRMLHDYGVAAGITVDVKPSLLRHTFAHRRLAETGDLQRLAKTLGHRHIVSSLRYLFSEPRDE